MMVLKFENNSIDCFSKRNLHILSFLPPNSCLKKTKIKVLKCQLNNIKRFLNHENFNTRRLIIFTSVHLYLVPFESLLLYLSQGSGIGWVQGGSYEMHFRSATNKEHSKIYEMATDGSDYKWAILIMNMCNLKGENGTYFCILSVAYAPIYSILLVLSPSIK